MYFCEGFHIIGAGAGFNGQNFPGTELAEFLEKVAAEHPGSSAQKNDGKSRTVFELPVQDISADDRVGSGIRDGPIRN